jgi:hypothetical protein
VHLITFCEDDIFPDVLWSRVKWSTSWHTFPPPSPMQNDGFLHGLLAGVEYFLFNPISVMAQKFNTVLHLY